MGYLVPIVVFVCWAATVLAAPRWGAFRGRRRNAAIAAELTSRHGFAAAPEFSASRLPVLGPPFHYGAAQRVTDQASGTVDGLAVTAAGYSCRYNGSTHVHGLAVVSLPLPLSRLEVRHERAFHSTLVTEPVPDGRFPDVAAELGERYEVYAEDAHLARMLLSPVGARELATAPERFSWRVDGADLLLWRSDGWSSAESLLASVRAVTTALAPAFDAGTGLATAGPAR